MHLIDNAWKDVIFADDVRGIHGATLAECLHVIQHGLDEYVLELFIGSKKKKTNKRLWSSSARRGSPPSQLPAVTTAPTAEDLEEGGLGIIVV